MYKSSYHFILKMTIVMLILCFVGIPVVRQRQPNIFDVLLILVGSLGYLLGKKRISKIVIDYSNGIIEFKVLHYLLLRSDIYTHTIYDAKVTEVERYFSGTTNAIYFEICLANNIKFEINTLVDGWTRKTLDELKEDIEKLQEKTIKKDE